MKVQLPRFICCVLNLEAFFLKAAQMVGKPDLAPDAWVRKLVMLCDAAPATPFSTVKLILEREGLPLHDFFEKFEGQPIGSASIAQVHRARVKGSTRDVAVKVQHPGVEELMMTDIRNLKAFAAFLQRFDIKFDLLSITDELEDQVQYEFDFVREATSMDRIADSMSIWNNGKPPVIIPRSIPGMVTRQVLVMDFIEGIPILRLEVELAKRGICADGTVARLAKRNILRDLTAAYGQMILRDGFFQADPHPGNILINNLGKVALLDYGQVKELQNSLRLDFANLVLAIASGKPLKISHCFKNLGIVTARRGEEDLASLKTMAVMMFDTKLPPGLSKVTPFGEESMLKKFPVTNFPKELFFILRTIHLLRGLSIGMGISYSCAHEWKQLAEAAVCTSIQEEQVRPLQYGNLANQTTTTPKKLVWEKRRKYRRLYWLQPHIL
eukprot:c20317_g1_i4 orf=478-1797(+)